MWTLKSIQHSLPIKGKLHLVYFLRSSTTKPDMDLISSTVDTFSSSYLYIV